jgi:hypothetical protein
MVKTKKFILAKHFVGEPKESDLQLVEEDLPALKDRGNYIVVFLVKHYMSKCMDTPHCVSLKNVVLF